MAAAFGVHFGATNASLAVCKDGKADVVVNASGDRVTPAVVAFTDHDLTVGLPAKQGLIRNASNTVCYVKQLLGRSMDDPDTQKIVDKSQVKVVEKNGEISYEVDYKEKKTTFSTTVVASHIYKSMLDIAAHQVGNTDAHDAVLAVPVDFSKERRKALSVAAEKAGFNILRIISEPSAAVLAYDIGQTSHSEQFHVLVFRLGGTSLDITVIGVGAGMYRILSHTSSSEVSGQQTTDVLVKHFAMEFKRQWKHDCMENKRCVAKLRNVAETCKHILSTMPTALCSVDSLYDGIDFQCNISRSRFEGLCSGIIQNCLRPIQDTLQQAGLSANDIHKVIACGGGTKMPSLQSQLASCLPSAELLTSLQPDEIIAIGAAKQAAILLGNLEEDIEHNTQDTTVPCLSADILIEEIGEGGESQYSPVFYKQSPVPARQQRSYTLAEGHTSFSAHILTPDCDNKHLTLAKLNMSNLKAGSKVNVVFHIRGDGSMHVTCTEPDTKTTADVLIEAS